MSHQGVTIVLFRADLFQPRENCLERAEALLRRIRAVPPAPGFTEVLAPGDPERRTRAIREREGIPIPDELWQELSALAKSTGVQIPLVAT